MTPNAYRIRPLMLSAIALIASGVLHLVLWKLSGLPWEGPLSFRKPALFGLSTGLTAMSLQWVWDANSPRKYDVVLQWITSWAVLVEVALITMQSWRGVPSHFNHSTTFDAVVHWGMDLCIVWITIIICDLTVRILRSESQEPVLLLAYQQGMLMLFVSCLIGFIILFIGFQQQSLTRNPSTYGEAGVLKFPHGIVIHALQFLPLIVWGMHGSQYARLSVILASVGCWGLLLFSVLQTFSGRARFDVAIVGGTLLAVCVGTLLISSGWAVLNRTRDWF